MRKDLFKRLNRSKRKYNFFEILKPTISSWLVVLLIFQIVAGVLFLPPIYEAEAVGWLSGYMHRKQSAVNATIAGIQTNYQMKLIVGESSGASGADVHCDGNSQNFPNDIRFTKEDGKTKHDYWIEVSSIEGASPNRKVSVWIEVDLIPSSGSVDFYIYYGKNGDVGESNGYNTFLNFDDFERADVSGVYFEDFLDTNNEESNSNITYSVHRPIKYGSNPVFEGGTWDEDKNYVDVQYIDGKYKMWYGAVDTAVNLHCCYAESDDGLNWTRPNLGLIEYGGNTNNNILLQENIFAPSVYYDSGASNPDRKYILQSPGERGVSCGSDQNIYFSPDGKNFSFGKTIYGSNPNCDGHSESMSIHKLDDGRWISYHQRYYTPQYLRAIGAQISDTEDIMGDWTNFGVLIPEVSASNQKYSIGMTYKDGRFYAFIPRYNKSTEKMDLSLWVSRDGLTWLEKDDIWVGRGGSGAWDESMILDGKSLTEVSNEWWFYYAGFKYDHAHSIPRESKVGLAKIGYGRIGGINAGATEGAFVSKDLFTLNTLELNGDASGGGVINLELLNVDGSPITGYTKADFDTITTDGYDFTPTWGGSSGLPAQPVKLKFYLQNADIYSYVADCANITYKDSIKGLTNYWIENPDNSEIVNNQLNITEGGSDDEWFSRKIRQILGDNIDCVVESRMKMNTTNSNGYLHFGGTDLKQWYLNFSTDGIFKYLNSSGAVSCGSYIADNWYKLSILHRTNNLVDYYIDDALKVSNQDGYTQSNWRIVSGEIAMGTDHTSSGVLSADWILARKYVSPEPTWSSWSSGSVVPTIQFTSINSSGVESVNSIQLELTLEATFDADITVDYTITGTATGDGTDYTLANGVATIIAGNTTTTIDAAIVDDASDESDETIIVTISNPVNASLKDNTVHTYTILDDDASNWGYRRKITLDPITPEANYQVKVILTSISLTEAQLTDSNANGNDIRFTGSDGITLQEYWIESWSAVGTTVTATIWVKVIDSGTSIIYMYHGDPNAGSASSGDHTFEFFDDYTSDPMSNWSSARRANDVSVSWWRGDTPAADRRMRWKMMMVDIAINEYGCNVLAGATPDSGDYDARDELCAFQVSNDTDYGASGNYPGITHRSRDSLGWSGYSYDTVEIAIDTDYVWELKIDAGVKAYVDIWDLNGSSKFSQDWTDHIPISYEYQFFEFWDYNNEQEVSWDNANNRLRVYIGRSLLSLLDFKVDWNFVAKYAVDEPAATLGSETVLPTIQFTSTSSSGAESVGSVQLELFLSAVFGSNVIVNYEVTGTAIGDGTDYTLVNGTATIIAGNTTTTIDAIIVDDYIVDEADETIIVTISNHTNANLGNNTVHTYTILNDDVYGTVVLPSMSSSKTQEVDEQELKPEKTEQIFQQFLEQISQIVEETSEVIKKISQIVKHWWTN